MEYSQVHTHHDCRRHIQESHQVIGIVKKRFFFESWTRTREIYELELFLNDQPNILRAITDKSGWYTEE